MCKNSDKDCFPNDASAIGTDYNVNTVFELSCWRYGGIQSPGRSEMMYARGPYR